LTSCQSSLGSKPFGKRGITAARWIAFRAGHSAAAAAVRPTERLIGMVFANPAFVLAKQGKASDQAQRELLALDLVPPDKFLEAGRQFRQLQIAAS